jgi:hypothetical protein
VDDVRKYTVRRVIDRTAKGKKNLSKARCALHFITNILFAHRSVPVSLSYRPRLTGERKRKSVRGCIVGSDLSVLILGACSVQ